MAPEYVPDFPAGRLIPHPRNVRVHDLESKRRSLENNTQYLPLVVQRSTGHILTGNGTFKAGTTLLGWTAFTVLLLDVDDQAALNILLADNATADKGDYDREALAALLAEYVDADGPEALLPTGYDIDEFETLMAELHQELIEPEPAPPLPPPPSHSPAALPGDEPEEDDEVELVALRFTDASDAEEFTALVVAARGVLGKGLERSEVALRGMRLLMSCLDHRHEAGAVDMATLLRAVD